MTKGIDTKDYIYSELIQFDEFKDLPEEQVKWLIDKSKLCVYQPGENVIQPGEPIDHMLIMLDGEVSITIQQGREFRPLGRFKRGSITGILPYSRMGSGRGYGKVISECTVLMFHKDHFDELIRNHYELTARLVHFTFDRIRVFTTFQKQNEKLMALGKLSAGLAHELNNPASAMVRSASALKEHVRLTPDKFKDMMKLEFDPEVVDPVNDFIFDKADAGVQPMSLMERTELEDEIMDWFDDHEVDDPDDMANTFAEFAITANELDHLNGFMPDKMHLEAVLHWMGDVLTTEKMVAEISDASSRISDLVSAIKVHSHMDQGVDKQPIDLEKVIHSTLTILNHKLRNKRVTVEQEIDPDLPEFQGYISELNQVWMNLLDNAIDAVEDEGQITVKAESDDTYVYINIIDNGSGIPEDIQSQIFDPFFTTKEMGKGTGLGLDVVRKIIDKHEGSIRVESKPGHTEFEICFPI